MWVIEVFFFVNRLPGSLRGASNAGWRQPGRDEGRGPVPPEAAGVASYPGRSDCIPFLRTRWLHGHSSARRGRLALGQGGQM